MQRRTILAVFSLFGGLFTLSKSTPSLARQMAEKKPASSPTVKGISHVGIAVSDMDNSVTFYRDLMGLTLMGGKTGRFEGEIYDNIFQLKNSRGRVAMLSAGNLRIELFEFENPRGSKSDIRLPVHHPRINHICFEVYDIQSEYNRLKRAGVNFHCSPQDAGYAKATYGRDPDGNIFELIEWSSGGQV